VTFGGGRSITRKYFRSVVNYYATNDPLVRIDSRAGSLFRKRLANAFSLPFFVQKTVNATGGKRDYHLQYSIHSNPRLTRQREGQPNEHYLHPISEIKWSNEGSKPGHIVPEEETRDHKHNTSYVFIEALARDIVVDHRYSSIHVHVHVSFVTV
jgi:hypothetical protein